MKGFLLLVVALCFLDRVDGSRPQLRADRLLGWQSENKNKGPYRGQPEGVHLAYGGKPNLISITWTTFDDVGNSSVEYGENGRFDRSSTAAVSEFVDGGAKQSVRFIHRALIEDVQAGHRYNYRVGSEHGWSSVFSFVGLEERAEGGYKIACFGDLGNINARSLGKLQRMSQDGDFDMVIHNGDFAYDLHDKNGDFGDEFFRQIEPMAAFRPLMTTAGNHDKAYNYSHYVNRFTMPNTDHNHFYSFDLGLTHFVAINTEFYYFNGRDEIETQWNWLADDLKKANANRNNVPWIVLYMHRSMYCSDVEGQCGTRELILREGLDWSGTFGLEKLIYESGIDLVIGAHEHSYERLYPIYDWLVMNGSQSAYEDPPAPVLLIVGSAGCQEETNHYKDPPSWSAFRSSNYGFGLLQVFNRTHLHYEQVRASEDGAEDEMWLVKTEHGTRTAADRERLKREGVYMKPSNFP